MDTYRARPINPAMPLPEGMQPSTVATYLVPQIGIGLQPVIPGVPFTQPISIAEATQVPCRVEVSNLGGGSVVLGFSNGSVQAPSGPGSQSYTLLSLASRVFLLAPGQKMWASTNQSGGVSVSVQVSEAFPFTSD